MAKKGVKLLTGIKSCGGFHLPQPFGYLRPQMWIPIVLLILCILQESESFYRTTFRVRANVLSSALQSDEPYKGPVQDFTEMIAGVQNEELGLNVMVGSSTLGDGAAGLGVFVAVSEEVEQTTVKEGQPLMGYSKGTFIESAEDAGDKTVAWLFSGVNQAIFFEKELMTLKDAMGIVSNRHDLDDMTDLLLGHKLYFDEEIEKAQSRNFQDSKELTIKKTH